MQELGGQVEGGKISGGGGTAEFGRAYVTPRESKLSLLDGWFHAENRELVWMSHGAPRARRDAPPPARAHSRPRI